MARQVVTVHGWSGTSSTLAELRHVLSTRSFEAGPIRLGDDVSMDDDVPIVGFARLLDLIIRRRPIDGLFRSESQEARAQAGVPG